MSDGNLVMKNIEHKKNCMSYFIVLEPDNLEQVDTEVLIPENSMGRIAMDTNEKGQHIYVPGRDHFFRYLYQDKKLIRVIQPLDYLSFINLLSNCKIVAQDTPSNLVTNINAKNAYFGESFKFN